MVRGLKTMQSKGTLSPAVVCSPWLLHPSPLGPLCNSVPHRGWVKQLPWNLLPPATCVAFSRGSLGEHLPQLLHEQQSREREENFLGSQECRCRTEGSRTNGSTSTKVNRNRTEQNRLCGGLVLISFLFSCS